MEQWDYNRLSDLKREVLDLTRYTPRVPTSGPHEVSELANAALTLRGKLRRNGSLFDQSSDWKDFRVAAKDVLYLSFL